LKVLPPSPQAIEQALEILRAGGVIAHATETCYGLACDLTNPKAVEKLFAIKRRPADQPVSALFSSVEEAKKYAQWNDRAEELAKKHLPGPLTLILPLHSDAPEKIYPSQLSIIHYPLSISIGVRISSHPLAQSLASQYGKPISTTSANIHGQPNTYGAEEIVQQFEHANMRPDLVLDSGILPIVPPSTVINLSSDTGGQTLRHGTIGRM